MKKLLLRIFFDFLSLITVNLIIYHFHSTEPYKRGFFCNDESIRYPDKPSTIPTWLLLCYSLVIPTFLVFVNLLSKYKVNKKFFWNFYCEYMPFIFGLFASQLITETAKISIGRLRPNFLSVCKLEKTCDINNSTYIEDFICLEKNSQLLNDIRLSFMSGHSSTIAYCMVYSIIFLQVNLNNIVLGLFKPLLQILFFLLSLYISLSRISDYKHHWGDVLTGYLQGAFTSIMTCIFLCELHKKRNDRFYDPNKTQFKNDSLENKGSRLNNSNYSKNDLKIMDVLE